MPKLRMNRLCRFVCSVCIYDGGIELTGHLQPRSKQDTLAPMKPDPFLGTWVMDPTRNDYQSGSPPVRGIYIIASHEAGYRITMRWTTADGEDREMQYFAVPDDQEYPLEHGMTARMKLVDDSTLDSFVSRDGTIVAHATRVLSSDRNTLYVTQSTLKPGGERLDNRSVYLRER